MKIISIVTVVFFVLTSILLAKKIIKTNCSNCKGRGSVEIVKHCPGCGGNGKVQSRCGAGCRWIDYTSMLGPTPIYSDTPNGFYGFSVNSACSNCGGSGFVSSACRTCRGIGRFRSSVKCSNCDGSGTVVVDVSNW